MPANAIPTPELRGYPPEIYFTPSDVLDAVDGAFEEARRKRREETVANIGAIALKAIPDCNLRCAKDPETGLGYDCYEYADDTWKGLPERMPDDVIRQTGVRIGEYAQSTGQTRMHIIFHGGEPLFTHNAADYYDHLIDLLEESVRGVNRNVTLAYSMQTNASLLTQSTLEMAKRRGILISCSLDGDEEAHNRNRKTKAHKLGSFKMVDRGIRRLNTSCNEQCTPECMDHFGDQFSGLLSVIDLQNDPIKTYEALCSYNPRRVDFMLPYANHDTPPASAPSSDSKTPYADWLLAIHRRWMADQKTGKSVPDIRLFSSIANLARGLPSGTEAIGPTTSSVAFVRADGSFEGLDALKAASRNTLETNMTVFDNSIEDVAMQLRTRQQLGRKSIAAACADCKLLEICGGGHIESRFSTERQFDNASIYCNDLKKLIKETVATTNAAYYDEVATEGLRRIRQQTPRRAVPKSIRPLYHPALPNKERKLALRIRPAEPQDVVKITDLHGEAYQAEYSGIIPPKALDNFISTNLLPRKYDYWQNEVEQVSRSGDRLFVATLGSKVLGFVALKPQQSNPAFALLNAHYVSPQIEGYGVENQLLSQVEHTVARPLIIRAQATAEESPQKTHLQQNGFTPGDFPTQKPVILGHELVLEPLERRPYAAP